MADDEFYPDIEEYLESAQNNNVTAVSSEGLDELIYKINAVTGLGYESCSILLTTILQEIRNSLLRGEMINLYEFGKIFIYEYYVKKTRFRRLKFKPASYFLNKVNGSDSE